ncbi:acyltransferase [Shewanella colwelliana]|uniref:acyltransferase family protein n=1 Tax=Shewanella colwelliana TaxID=23 RepID=UPI00299D0AFC|nr:acyltransferase [Shewanella colwelliana]MDX1281574.1 acyltransferase [Shewanella colwelliana]
MVFQSLQIGRGFAALLVLFFHLSAALGAEKYFNIEALSVPFSFGHVGVEFFFVLSGFIIFSAHKKEIFRGDGIQKYIFKRISRVYPVYMIVFLIIFSFLFVSSSLPSEFLSGGYELFFKSLFLLPQDKNIIGGTGAPILIVAWTLQYEMMFYFLFLLLLYPFFISLFFFLVLSLYFFFSNDSFLVSFVLSDYTLLFLLGIMVFHLFGVVKPPQIFSVAIFMLSILLLSVFSTLLVMTNDFVISHQIIIFGVIFSLVIYSSVSLENHYPQFFEKKLLLLIGSSSYSLYLLHYPMISVFCKIFKSLGWTEYGTSFALLIFFILSLVCIFVSIIFHLVIEKPIGAYLNRFWVAYEGK